MPWQTADVVVLFALEEEFGYFYDTIKGRSQTEEDSSTSRAFVLFEAETIDGPPYRCVTTFVGSMGAQDAEHVARMCLDRYVSVGATHLSEEWNLC